jgi:hypothetical protein
MMKKIFFVALAIAIVIAASATSITPALQNAFNKQFGMVENITWKQHANGFSASFSKQNSAWQANYDQNGKWSHTIRIIFYNQLPLRVWFSIQKKYSLEDVLSIHEYELAEGESFYLVHVDGKYLKYYADGDFELIANKTS